MCAEAISDIALVDVKFGETAGPNISIYNPCLLESPPVQGSILADMVAGMRPAFVNCVFPRFITYPPKVLLKWPCYLVHQKRIDNGQDCHFSICPK